MATTFSCDACAFTTDRKLNYMRHCNTDKHKLKCNPAVKSVVNNAMTELATLKMTELQAKNDFKMKELELKNEIKMKESMLKEKLKQDIKQEIVDMKQQTEDDSDVVTMKQIEDSCSVWTFKEKVIERFQLEDFDGIYTYTTTLEDCFLRDFLAEYATNKCVVIEKNSKILCGYYKNEFDVWNWKWEDHYNEFVTFATTMPNGYKMMTSLIHQYYDYAYRYAKDNDRPVKHFKLEQDTVKKLEDFIKEVITKKIDYKL